MQLSQKLKALQYILESNKEKELSFCNTTKLITEDTVYYKYHSIIKSKYEWLDIIEWAKMYNVIWNVAPIKKLIYYIFNINLYKENLYTTQFWASVEEKTIINTFFNIEDSKVFIKSFLDTIDKEKEKLNTFNYVQQVSNIENLIEKSKKSFNNSRFPISIKIKDYISSYNQYYKTIKELNNKYNIENIQIYNWVLTFSLSLIQEREIKVTFDWKDILIDGKIVYFQNYTSITYNLLKLSFEYFLIHKTNTVDFYTLSKYQKENSIKYWKLNDIEFSYVALRRSIETKNAEIMKKNELDSHFLTTKTSWIQCPLFIPEE